MIDSTIETVEGLIESINDYLEDAHIDKPLNYSIAEEQKKILENTLIKLKIVSLKQ